MRWLDRWVGPPLCAALSVWDRARQPAGPVGAPHSIAFIALAEVGALVLAYPAVARARRLFPGAKICFVTFRAGESALEMMGLDPDERIIIDASHPAAFLRGTRLALRRLRAARVDTVINLETYARFSALLSYLSGAARRVGFHRFTEEGHYLGALYTNRLGYNPHMHVSASYASLVDAAAQEPGTEPLGKAARPGTLERLRWSPPEAASRKVAEKLASAAPSSRRRLVVLNANASDLVSQRRWPAQNYVVLARRLLADDGIMLVLTGTTEERGAALDLARDIGSDRTIVLAGETTLPELIALYEMADLLVTNDSGPVHFASVTEVPTLALFGPETPAIFGPVGPNQQALYAGLACSPCVSAYNQKRSPCTFNACMRAITPEQVYESARRILAARRTTAL